MRDTRLRFAAMSRRAALTGAALAGMVVLTGCEGGGPTVAEGDMALGSAEGAKVTVIEYASVTCGVCAAWQEQVWPGFKAKYVDTGKVRFVFREYPTPPQDIAVAGFLMARCAGADKYFDVVHQIMASQKEWRAGVQPRQSLYTIGAGAGLSEQQITQCITNPEAIAAMDARVNEARQAGVGGTPTFMVNGQRVANVSLEGLSAAVDAELAK